MPVITNYMPVSLFKRLISILYDQILVIAIFMLLGILMNTLTTFIVNDGNAITEEHPFYLANQIILLLTFFISSFSFYSWFWIHGGQTLGMKTWRLLLQNEAGTTINLKQAAIRYFVALLSWGVFGLGFLWSFVDDKKRCWHDILSGSHLVQLEKS